MGVEQALKVRHAISGCRQDDGVCWAPESIISGVVHLTDTHNPASAAALVEGCLTSDGIRLRVAASNTLTVEQAQSPASAAVHLAVAYGCRSRPSIR